MNKEKKKKVLKPSKMGRPEKGLTIKIPKKFLVRGLPTDSGDANSFGLY